MIMIKQTAFSFPLRSSKIGEVIKDADAYAIDLHFACTEHGYTTVHGVPISATSFKFIADGVLLNGNNRKKAN
jgi:predicted ester cyclase